MAKRGKPGANRVVALDMPEQDKHQGLLSEMHDALYSLGEKIRKPFNRGGEKLLPKPLRSSETPESKAARAHIQNLHKSMKACKDCEE